MSYNGERAKFLVWRYICDHLDKIDKQPMFNVYEVWHCYILGNEKWLFGSNLPDGMYYEVTYDWDKQEFYLDAYKKFQNYNFPMETATKLYLKSKDAYHEYCY